jgi:hypothetical protein
VQTEQRNSLRLLQWMMAASVALPVALFAFVSAISWASTRDTADRHLLYVSAGAGDIGDPFALARRH